MARRQGLSKALLRLRLLRRQDGIALIVSMGVLSMLTISGTTVMVYTNSNTKTSALSRSNEK
jgi:Tfp pilus assembly protein PilX